MLTRVPEAMRESAKQLSAEQHGNLRTMCETLLARFLAEKPYKSKSFSWVQPAKKGTPGWVSYNVVVSDELSARVKAESVKIEVSLTTLLYTALDWWIEQERKS